MTDLDKLRRGEKELIEAIYRDCYPAISAWVKKNSGSVGESEDIFHDALVATFNKAKDPNFVLSCKLTTFVFSVAKNLWLNQLRTRGRFVHTETDSMEQLAGPAPDKLDEVVLAIEREKIYKRYFGELSSKCQKILKLYFSGVSMEQIAKNQGFENEGVARKRKFRCKEELISLVKKDPQYVLLRNDN